MRRCFSRYGLFTSCCFNTTAQSPHQNNCAQTGQAQRVEQATMTLFKGIGLPRTHTTDSFLLSSSVRMYWSVSSSSSSSCSHSPAPPPPPCTHHTGSKQFDVSGHTSPSESSMGLCCNAPLQRPRLRLPPGWPPVPRCWPRAALSCRRCCCCCRWAGVRPAGRAVLPLPPLGRAPPRRR